MTHVRVNMRRQNSRRVTGLSTQWCSNHTAIRCLYLSTSGCTWRTRGGREKEGWRGRGRGGQAKVYATHTQVAGLGWDNKLGCRRPLYQSACLRKKVLKVLLQTRHTDREATDSRSRRQENPVFLRRLLHNATCCTGGHLLWVCNRSQSPPLVSGSLANRPGSSSSSLSPLIHSAPAMEPGWRWARSGRRGRRGRAAMSRCQRFSNSRVKEHL